MEDAIDEELQIANEQDADPTFISAKIFREKIKTFDLKKVCTAKESTTLEDAVKQMQENEGGSLVIVDKDGKVSGILTERDFLMKVLGKVKNWEKEPVSSAMTPDPFCLQCEDMIAHVMHNMHIGGYRHIPIVDNEGKPILIVSVKDVVSFIFEQFPAEIDNILDEPFKGKHVREGA
jgi:signal-transduction protein with cAMP-binding, CBS, and nucleotidyltransferase domain